MKKSALFLLVGALLLSIGCGSKEPDANPVKNPEKGEGTSKDGGASQAGPADTSEAS